MDDAKSIRLSLREILRDAGHEADVAEDAQGARTLLAAGAYDVVVSDVRLFREKHFQWDVSLTAAD